MPRPLQQRHRPQCSRSVAPRYTTAGAPPPPPIRATKLLLTAKYLSRRILRLSSLRAQVDALDIYADRIPQALYDKLLRRRDDGDDLSRPA